MSWLGFFEQMLQQPLWLQGWILWLVAVNSASVFFLRHREGRWVFAVWMANALTMIALFESNGYNRLLGLSHVLWWTPLLLWLLRRRETWDGAGTLTRWLQVLMATIGVSLMIDYIDVLRYLLGDRS